MVFIYKNTILQGLKGLSFLSTLKQDPKLFEISDNATILELTR